MYVMRISFYNNETIILSGKRNNEKLWNINQQVVQESDINFARRENLFFERLNIIALNGWCILRSYLRK